MKCQDYDEIYRTFNITPSNLTRQRETEDCFLIDHEHHQKMTTTSLNEWYQWTNRHISSLDKNEEDGEVRQEEYCDCYRSQPFRPGVTFENRYYSKKTRFGTIKVTYMQNFLNSMHFHHVSFLNLYIVPAWLCSNLICFLT